MVSHDTTINRRILLAARPQGRPTPQDFQLDTSTPVAGGAELRESGRQGGQRLRATKGLLARRAW
ncbi:MAG TPA: hypothetical protein VLJ58_04960 [Ramlibacter sp.]|nr:hypothetical protein [Ramlibacter sp.]